MLAHGFARGAGSDCWVLLQAGYGPSWEDRSGWQAVRAAGRLRAQDTVMLPLQAGQRSNRWKASLVH